MIYKVSFIRNNGKDTIVDAKKIINYKYHDNYLTFDNYTYYLLNGFYYSGNNYYIIDLDKYIYNISYAENYAEFLKSYLRDKKLKELI